MKALLIMKQQLIRFYTRYEVYIQPVLKFLAMLIALLLINSNVGYMTKLKNPAIVLILSLICSFMPVNLIVVISGIVIVAHMYAMSLQCAVVVFVLFAIMYALYFRFTPKDAIAVLLTPIAFKLNMPYAVPFSMGFVGSPLSAISVGCGTVTYYMLEYIKNHENSLSGSASLSQLEDTLAGFKGIIDGILKNDEMFLMVIVFAVIIIFIYLIRRLRINYSWQIALGVGAVVGFVFLLAGSAALDADISIAGALFGMIFSALLVIILQFFVFNVDYSRAEYVQFEDDEYYYYVKAIPKVTLDAPNVGVRTQRTFEDDYYDEDEEYYEY